MTLSQSNGWHCQFLIAGGPCQESMINLQIYEHLNAVAVKSKTATASIFTRQWISATKRTDWATRSPSVTRCLCFKTETDRIEPTRTEMVQKRHRLGFCWRNLEQSKKWKNVRRSIYSVFWGNPKFSHMYFLMGFL